MNLKEIKEMISLMNENNLTEIELEREGLKIRLKRGSSQTGAQPNIFIERAPAQEVTAGAIPPALKTQAESLAIPTAENKNILEIKAPMVGTFYRAPSPEAEPFAEVGAEIEIGQVVCIIEAMKLMNEIKSEVKGKIKEMLVKNGDPLEFGQVMFRIEPT